MSGEAANGWVEDSGSTSGSTVIPMIGVHPDFPLQDKAVSYTLVNFIGQNWTHEKQLVGAELKSCNNCHRIGAGNTLRTWATRSVGLDTNYNNMITEAFLNDWGRVHYMPFDPRPGAEDPLPSESAWDSSEYATAISYIESCKNADQDSQDGPCKFIDIPREVDGIIVDPDECWSDIPDDCDY